MSKYRDMLADKQAFDAKLESLPPAPSALAVELARIEDEGLGTAIANAEAAQAKAKLRAATDPLEKTVLARIRRALERAGCRVHRMQSGVSKIGDRTIRSGEPGMPDLLCFLPKSPTAFWVEVKSASGELSPIQRSWYEGARLAGQHVCVARSPDEALLFLRSLASTSTEVVDRSG